MAPEKVFVEVVRIISEFISVACSMWLYSLGVRCAMINKAPKKLWKMVMIMFLALSR